MKKKFKFSEIYMASKERKFNDDGAGWVYATTISNSVALLKIGDYLCETDETGTIEYRRYTLGQIISTKEREISTIAPEKIEAFIREKEKEDKYKDKPYAFLFDVQRFDRFLQQFGINIEELEPITLAEASAIMRDFYTGGKEKLIMEFLKAKSNLKTDHIFYISMNETFKKFKMKEIFEAIQNGTFTVFPSFFGLKKKSLIKRLFTSHKTNTGLLIEEGKDPFLDRVTELGNIADTIVVDQIGAQENSNNKVPSGPDER